MYSNKKIVQSLGEILISKYIFNIIISPGSRNAPIIVHFTQHKKFNTYSIVDERCAGFFALGMAQKIRKPVVMSCTSGSAVVNYYPSITEAFYQKIPLIVITADRPKEIIDVYDGQSIHQENIFNNHVEMSIQLTEDESVLGLWYNEKLINESINKCFLSKRPIHINIPFSEPLYQTTNRLKVKPKIIDYIPTTNYIIKSSIYKKEKYLFHKYKKKMILIGLCHIDYDDIKKFLLKFRADPSVVIFTETTSNIINEKICFSNIDELIFNMKNEDWIKLKPHILITIGVNIISKKIKSFLRKFPPLYHWHIGGENMEKYPDTYYKLSTYWPISEKYFFQNFCSNYHIKNHSLSDYRYQWEKIKKKKISKQEFFIKKEKSFSDLKALFLVFKSVPDNSILQLGNSMVIRYYQLFHDKKKSITSYCNRGTSGIDGCVSTAIGMAVSSKKIVTLIVGDISFFYDSNALWNNYTPKNFRIILINNRGGNIFRFISKIKISEKISNFFETKHKFSANTICKMHKFKYEGVSNYYYLKKKLSYFWNNFNKPFLLEIKTHRYDNAKILKKYLLLS
ncbi:2-succinyl-5-enolpyruvyl-6-hydroxy-3-cyclohexene-1-carboxylic-acid synthase [Blattabacterium cuenoti]|uniref:2-succinyl-5-enolpyruvyl-6-hydroxy-3- cyclohexene-1-carboxylic-acid synthase n=1 Tax=Blattabacterium cuenoti TaxID=1653831 RepID=UPI00163BA9DD|nr:2-succinyl-5-enolpyruvyl-6-hydroxy-3-cyclohexene-1-carboxylic-acid synthase [Blattabacterium cuenoti]